MDTRHCMSLRTCGDNDICKGRNMCIVQAIFLLRQQACQVDWQMRSKMWIRAMAHKFLLCATFYLFQRWNFEVGKNHLEGVFLTICILVHGRRVIDDCCLSMDLEIVEKHCAKFQTMHIKMDVGCSLSLSLWVDDALTLAAKWQSHRFEFGMMHNWHCCPLFVVVRIWWSIFF